MQELATIDSESLLLRTPTASQGQGGALGEAEARKRGNTVGIRDQAMDLAKLQGHKVSRESDNLLPTPTTRDYKDGSAEHERDGKVQTDTVARAIFNSGEISTNNLKVDNKIALLKTPIAKEGLSGNTQTTVQKSGQLWLSNDVQDISLINGLRQETVNINLGEYASVNWGKFELAIRRWEATLGRPAPKPTKPDGRDNAHRLSSKFTEWMMGLPDGWVTSIGLSRNDELKLCGNGVVPQQAELALKLLLKERDDVLQ